MESRLALIALIAVAIFSSSAETAALGYTTPFRIFAGGADGFWRSWVCLRMWCSP